MLMEFKWMSIMIVVEMVVKFRMVLMMRLVVFVLMMLWCKVSNCWFLFFSCTCKSIVILFLAIRKGWFDRVFMVLIWVDIMIMVKAMI